MELELRAAPATLSGSRRSKRALRSEKIRPTLPPGSALRSPHWPHPPQTGGGDAATSKDLDRRLPHLLQLGCCGSSMGQA